MTLPALVEELLAACSELIFSHLVSFESKLSLAPLAITRFALRNHTPSGDCLAKIALLCKVLSMSVSLVGLLQLTDIVCVVGL
jgi:hypothetical protein